MSSVLEEQRRILAHVFDATSGPAWREKKGWGTEAPLENWVGVTVENDHVVKLKLPINRVKGSIPPQLGQLSNLRDLVLHSNNLEGSIPRELGSLKNLQTLDLSTNKLTGNIPPQLGQLWNLRELWLSGNNLEGSIPPELGSLEKLEVLSLYKNRLTGNIPPELGHLSNLRELKLHQNSLEGNIPPQLGQLSNLRELWLNWNSLEGSIPPELGSLRNLRVLSLWDNKLTGNIPPELGRLQNLRELVLAQNNLEGSIPRELGRLQNLKRLYLSNNNLTGPIPAALIGRLGMQITHYSFYRNSLSLPEDINTQNHLTKLHLSNQGLVGSIPAELGRLSQLTSLDLNDNKLTGLDLETAQSLLQLPHRLSLDISGNSFAGLPDSVCQNGLASVVQFLKDLERSGPATSWDLKAVLLGTGSAGKTSLLRSILEGRPARTKEESPSTVLVETHVWRPPERDGKTLKVHFWDFGGQQCYSAIHPLFLTQEALFVLVVDLHRFETTPSPARSDVTPWLEVVQAQCPGSVVVVVGTHSDKCTSREPQDILGELEAEVKEHAIKVNIGARSPLVVKGFFALSSESFAGVEAVMEHIQSLALDSGHFPSVGMAIPKSWRDVYFALSDMREEGHVVSPFSDVVKKARPTPRGLFAWKTCCRGGGDSNTAREALRLHETAGFVLLGGAAGLEVVHLDPTWLMALIRPLADHKLSERQTKEGGAWNQCKGELFAPEETETCLVGEKVVYSKLLEQDGAFCSTGRLNSAYLFILWKHWHQCRMEGEEAQEDSEAVKDARDRVLGDGALFTSTRDTLVRQGILISVGMEGAETCEYVVPARLASVSEQGPLRAFRCWGAGGKVWEKGIRADNMPFPVSTLALFLASVGSGHTGVDIKACSSSSAFLLVGDIAVFVAVGEKYAAVYAVPTSGGGERVSEVRNRCYGWLKSTLDNRFPGLLYSELPDVPPKEGLFSSLSSIGAGCDTDNYDVFLSHAGPEKRGIVFLLYRMLEMRGIATFLDETSLRAGDGAEDKMLEVANAAPIGVVVLSPSFVCREWPLREMQIFTDRAEKKEAVLVPLFFGLTVDECGDTGKLEDNHRGVKETWGKWSEGEGGDWGWLEKDKFKTADELAKDLLGGVGAHTGLRNDQQEDLFAFARRVTEEVNTIVREFDEKKAAPKK